MDRKRSLAARLAGIAACTLLAAASPSIGRATEREATAVAGFGQLSAAYVSMAIQGDLRPARQLFERAAATGAAGAALRATYEARFLEPSDRETAHGEGLAEGVARAWRRYWRRNLLREADESRALAELGEALSRLLETHGYAAPSQPDPATLTREALARDGYRQSLSAAPPWLDLFAWKSQQSATYRVELTDVAVPVEVVFMDDFLVQGWKDHASLGLASTTGWVEDGRLYCVGWTYDPNSENFRVSYLKHEARHLVDLKRYPGMDSTELEYRAKLTELAFAQAGMERIWNDFRAKAADNPESAHAMANWRITRDVARVMGGRVTADSPGRDLAAESRRVHRVARRLLRESTAWHDGQGGAPGRAEELPGDPDPASPGTAPESR